MNKKQHHVFLDEFFGANKGVWTLILVHLVILSALVLVFHEIILKLQQF